MSSSDPTVCSRPDIRSAQYSVFASVWYKTAQREAAKSPTASPSQDSSGHATKLLEVKEAAAKESCPDELAPALNDLPADAKPVEAKPAEAKPAEAKPAEAKQKQAEGKPGKKDKQVEQADATEKKKKRAEEAAKKKAEAAARKQAAAAEAARKREEMAAVARAAEERAIKLAQELRAGVHEIQGERSYMEDVTQLCRLDNGDRFLAIYDGHCGAGVAKYAADHLHKTLESLPEFQQGDVAAALEAAFLRTSADFIAGHDDGSGTTATAAVLHGDMLYLAHVGDSRCCLYSSGAALVLTEDHTPDNTKEEARVIAAGGGCEMGRVVDPSGNGIMLQVSRSLGDGAFKVNDIVSPKPVVLSRPLVPEDSFLVIASDGVWDVLSEQQVCAMVKTSLETNTGALHMAAREVVDKAHKAGSEDNICAVVALLS